MMIRSAIPAGQALDLFRSKPNLFSNLTFESCKCFRPNWLTGCLAGQGITTSTSNTRGKEEKEMVESMIKPVKMAYTSYELTKGSDPNEPPVIIMHGLLGSKSNWNSLSRAIHNKTKRKVIAVDARNHGESPHTVELTYNHLAADIKEFMTDLNSLTFVHLSKTCFLCIFEQFLQAPKIIKIHTHFDTCTVIAVDARNHGESPHTVELTYNHLAADIKEFMTDLNIPKATLIGHSMGGRAVMLVALRYPELVKDLIIVDISPLRISPNLKHMLKCFEAMRLVKIEPKIPLSNARKSADSQLSKYISDPGLRQFLLTNLVEGEDGRYKWRVNLESIASNFATNISNFPPVSQSLYDGLTLFIGGTASDYLLKDEEKDIRKLFPKASFNYIQDAGHWVHSEKPQEFLNVVTSFIQNPDEFLQKSEKVQ